MHRDLINTDITGQMILLGTGTSVGVPAIGCDSPVCLSDDPRNNRTRTGVFVPAPQGNFVIDTSPELRIQLVRERIPVVHAALFTHSHADHLHGIDDLRTVVQNRGSRLPVWADAETAELLLSRFAYVFVQPAGSLYKPILDLNPLDGPVTVEGAGGPITFAPFRVQHGRMEALGFRIGDFAYLPDVSEIPDAAWPALMGLECWILDALRYRPHPTHTHVAQSLEWIARAAPRRAILTNMHNDLDYAVLDAETPANVTPAYDGMRLDFQL